MIRCLDCPALIPGRKPRCGPCDIKRRGTRNERTAFRAAVLARDGERCVLCGSTDRVEAGHIVSIANGGAALDVSNGQSECFRCNRKKGAN